VSRATDAVLVVLVVVAFGTIVVWGHADARFEGVDATVTDTTCTAEEIPAFTLRVSNERDTPVSFTLSVHAQQTDRVFWQHDGRRRVSVPASTTERLRFAAGRSSHRVPLFAFDYDRPRNRTRTIVTLYDISEGTDGQMTLRGLLSCEGFHSFR